VSNPNSAGSSALDRLAAKGLLPANRPSVGIAPGLQLRTLGESYRGALLGTAIGDALGRPVEGRSPVEIRQRFGRLTDFVPWRDWKAGPKGTVTDDTQMTMCVAECLLECDGRVNPVDLAERLIAWLPVGRGKGRACAPHQSASRTSGTSTLCAVTPRFPPL
jgi:hypothetical protein